MTTEDYKNMHADLIKERDHILEQINAIEDPSERRRWKMRYEMTSLNAAMIREVEGVLRQHGLLE